jgi:hypothetical protein
VVGSYEFVTKSRGILALDVLALGILAIAIGARAAFAQTAIPENAVMKSVVTSFIRDESGAAELDGMTVFLLAVVFPISMYFMYRRLPCHF